MLRIARAIRAWPLLLLSLVAFSGAVEAASGLGFLQSLPNGFGGLDNLRGVDGLVVSPDGKNVYATAKDDDALVVFTRSTQSGLLSFLEVQIDNTGDVDGLDNVRAVAVSADGANVYTAASRDDAVAVFRRDSATGALTFVERKRDGVDGVEGLNGAGTVVVSPDDRFVYVGGTDDDAIAVFARDQATGALTWIEVQRNGSLNVTGLNGVRHLTITADGAHLYAVADRASSLTVFRRNLADGRLTFFPPPLKDAPDNSIDGLDLASSVVVSPDGKHVYTAGARDDAIGLFSRDESTGTLTFVSVVRDGVGGVEGLFGVKGLAMAPDGAHLYAAGTDDNAVTVFERDAATGALTFAGAHVDGVGDVTGLAGAEAAAVSPDGTSVYVAGTSSDAVTVFSTHCGDGTVDPDEQCDDGNAVSGDACSPGCRIECSAESACDDADTCTEQRCRGGECSNPRCGFDGSLCQLADSVPELEDEPTCAPVPPKLRRAIVKRINRAGRHIQIAKRRTDPDLSKLVTRVSTEITAIDKRAARLEKNHRIPAECRTAIGHETAVLSDSLADMLLHRQSCAP